MELVNGLGASRLMQAVDVLGDDRFQPALPFQLCQPQVGRVGLCPMDDELLAVEVKKFCGVGLVEGVGEHRLGRVLEFLVVQPVHRAEIGDAALGRDAGAAEKHDPVAAVDPLF